MTELSEILLFDSRFKGRLLLALQRAISSQFNETDWLELGYETMEADYIQGHPRLLRSLRFGDEDYGACIYQILSYFVENNNDALQRVIDNKKVRRILERNAQDILSELGLLVSRVPSVKPKSLSAIEVVERALADADHLLQMNGPISCVDRLHTAFHGYVRSLCHDAGIVSAEGASLTALFKQLRTSHPAFQTSGSQDNEISKIINGFGSVVDAINTIRNNASIAHPNEVLLGEDEANLVVNAIRSLFHYVSSKVR